MSKLSKIFSSNFSLVSKFDSKKIMLVMSVMIITFVLDSKISVVADFISHQISSSWGVAIFICFAIIFIVGQIFILDYVKQINKGTSRAKEFQWSITHIIVTIAQFILAAIVVFVILQVLITQQYNL